jgi:hypothetical protein
MFSRISHEETPVIFPKEWSENVKKTLLSIYGEQCIKEDRTFEIFTFTYPTELLLIISYSSLDKIIAPITLFLSSNLNEKNDPKKTMNNMFDAVGVFFDSFFGSRGNNEAEIWDEFIYEWQESEFAKQQFYYKVTRENIALSLEAESILNKG